VITFACAMILKQWLEDKMVINQMKISEYFAVNERC
jgi:hypothetical protein